MEKYEQLEMDLGLPTKEDEGVYIARCADLVARFMEITIDLMKSEPDTLDDLLDRFHDLLREY